MINFNATKKDIKLITKIAQRAVKMNPEYDYMDASMDVTAVHLNDCKLDLKKLLGFDDFNFAHDVFGINRHINRGNGKLQNCFLPRCSR